MNRIWTAIAIAAAMVILCGVLLHSADVITDEMTAALDKLSSAHEDDQWVQAAVEELCARWDKHENALTCHVRHSEIEEVSFSLTELKTCWEMGEYELFVVACEEAKMAVEHLWEAARPSLKNIL